MNFEASDPQLTLTVFLNYFYLVYLIVGWGLAIDIAMIIGRYYRAWPLYLKKHKFICFILNITFVIFIPILMILNRDIIQMINTPETSLFNKDLIILAIIVLLKIAIIVFSYCHGGKLSKTIQKTQQEDAIPFHKFVHQISGIFTFIFAKLNIFYSFKLTAVLRNYNEASTLLAVSAFIFFFFLLYVFCEIGYRRNSQIFDKDKVKQNFISLSNPPQFLSDLNKELQPEIIKQQYPNVNWLVLNNSVYDFTQYFHPGGNFMINRVVGKEVGRYFYGSFSLETSSILPYTHSVFSDSTLRNYYIGELEFGNTNIVVEKLSNQATLIDESENWMIEEETIFSENLALFYFKNNKYLFKNNNSGVRWLGRHFLISAKEEQECPHQRQYTTLICYSKENIEIQGEILNFIRASEGKTTTKISIKKSYQENSDTFPAVIKSYPKENKFSKHLFQQKMELYSNKGPYGFGLELNDETDTLNGTYVFFAGGTGILPFLDFFQLFAKSLLIKYLQSIGENPCQQINKYTQNKLKFNEKSFKIILLASFKNEKEILGKEIISIINLLQDKLGINIFEATVRLSNINKVETSEKNNNGFFQYSEQKFDQIFILKRLDPYGDLIQQIYICGSHPMNQEVFEILNDSIEYQNKIMIY